jgi:hypothetical protein
MGLFYLAGVAVLAVAGVGGVLVLGRRWGVATRAIETTGTPYRSATVHVKEWRAAPGLVSLAAALNVIWAVATLLVFVPAGTFLLLVGGVLAAAVLVLVVDGIGVGLALLYASRELMRRRRGAADVVERMALWSIAHHFGVVLIVLAVFALHGESSSLVLGALLGVLPGGIGIWLAALLSAAGKELARAEAEEGEAA